MSLTEKFTANHASSMLIHTWHGKVLSNLNLVTNIIWEKTQAMRHVVISAQDFTAKYKIKGNIDELYCIFYRWSENITSFGLPLTFPLTYCSALQNFKRL